MQKAKKVLNHFGYNESQFDISDVYTGHRKKTVNEIFEKAIEGVDMDTMAKSTWLDDNMYVIAQASLKNILVQEEAKFFIENFRGLKDYMIENTLLYEPKKQVKFIWSLVKEFENM